MALTDKLTAIADAIRAKSGKSDTLTLDAMPTEIGALTAEDIIQHADIPDYVKKEALEVAQKVRSVQQSDSIVFLAMADTHYYGKQGESGVDGYVDGNGTQNNTSSLHGAMAAKTLAYALDFDFMAHLGDATWGHKTTTSELLNSQVDTLFDMLRESHANLPCFHAIGNHDTGLYYHNNMIEAGNTGIYTETGENLYNKFTALSASDDTVFGDTTYGGYCYRDFADKKLRVFLLNSCDSHVYNQTDGAMLGSQLLWFANALSDLNSKSDAANWGFVVLCHYPADYGGMMPFSELLKAYVEDGSCTIELENGVSFTGNFQRNVAKFIAQFHGHVHNFKTSKLYSYATGKGVQYDAWRMCIPNGQYNRENYYSTVGSYTDIDFSEDVSYSKTPNTANDTSFVVNVINPSEQKIYSFCYGAGYDRVIGYAATVYYSINSTLKNVASSNDAASIEEGLSYSATLTPTDGYELSAVTVTMGGEDITSTAYSGGVITIANVTGNVVITATAVEVLNVINQLPISTDTDGSIYNGKGYKENTYLTSGYVGSRDGIYTSGFIPCVVTDTLYFKNVGMQTGNGNHRICAYDANKRFIATSQFATNTAGASDHVTFNFGTDGNIETITFNPYSTYYKNVVYIRFCCSYLGEDSIVTVNEPIE